MRSVLPAAHGVAALAVAATLLAATGCGPRAEDRPECSVGGSTLSGIAPRTGRVLWTARLDRTSERPLLVQDGTAVVTAPCGAAVVDLADGEVLYDDATPGNLVGVAGRQLFTLDESVSHDPGSIPITGFDLGSPDRGSSFSTNTPYQAATVAHGSLVTLYGDTLEAADESGAGPSWSMQLPPSRHPQLLPSGRRLLVTTEDGSTYALDLTDGRLGWRSVPPVPALFYAVRLTTVPGTVLTAATTDDDPQRLFVYATDAGTGRLRWSRPAVSVLGADRDLTVLRTVHAVEAVGTRSGALLWRRPASRAGAPADAPRAALSPDTVVLPQPGAQLLGLDRAGGRVLWRGPESLAAIADGQVVVTTTPGGITARDPATGDVRWRLPVDRSHQELALAPGGELLLLDSDLVPHLGA